MGKGLRHYPSLQNLVRAGTDEDYFPRTATQELPYNPNLPSESPLRPRLRRSLACVVSAWACSVLLVGWSAIRSPAAYVGGRTPKRTCCCGIVESPYSMPRSRPDYFVCGRGALAGGTIPFIRKYSTICPYSS